MAGERILIVDDSKYMVSFLADVALPTLGYRPLVATTGQSGLEKVSKEKPDLILLDFNLPDMTGMDIVRHMAAAGIQTPVILMTAYGSEKVAVEAFRLGVRDYLTKPVELDQVANALERALHAPRLQRDKRLLAQELQRANVVLGQQMERVDTFASIGRAITASLDLDQILTQVINASIQLCQAEEATIWLLEEGEDDLIMVAEKGVDQEAIQLPRIKVRDGLAGEAIRTRRPVCRAAGEGEGIKVKTAYLVQAVAYVPILIQERCLGVILVANRRSSHTFDKRDQESLLALADYAAIAIENARLYQSTDKALQKRLEELAAINEISEAVATLDLKLLLRRAMNRIHRAFDVQDATLFLADDNQSHLHFTFSSKLDSHLMASLRVPFGQGIVGSCVSKGTGFFTNDPYGHPLFMPEIDETTGFKTESLLAVPLIIKERVIGAIELLNKRSGRFDDRDASLLRAMAMPVAAAVANARLFDQIALERATLQAVLEGSANPIWIVNQAGHLLLCNPAAQKLCRLPPTGSTGLPLEAATGLPRLAELVAQGQMVTQEITFQGSTYLTSVAPIAGVGSVVEMQDISYLKELDKAKSEFVTIVSHDLRSPLTAIVGFIDLLSLAGPLNQQQQQFVGRARESTQRMKRLINDLLNLAKIEAGLGPAEEPCHLDSIAQGVVDEFQGMAMHNNLQLTLLKRGEIPILVGHAGRLRRALANLVGNALKYTPAGGQVRVGLQASAEKIYLAVQDTGRGIPEKDRPHIFEKFYRVPEHSDTEGSGLGLAMVKSIVESHGGTISVRSQVGKGSSFTIVLPPT